MTLPTGGLVLQPEIVTLLVRDGRMA
jgi:hypothetical protein